MFGAPKNGKTRVVSLPPSLTGMLIEQAAGKRAGDLLFTTPSGTLVRQSIFYRRVFKPAVRGVPATPARKVRRGKPDQNGQPVYRAIPARPAVPAALSPDKAALRFHDLRHTAASLFIATGADPKTVMERMGHSSITTTFNLYGHLFEGHDSALLAGLDSAFNAAANVVPIRRAG